MTFIYASYKVESIFPKTDFHIVQVYFSATIAVSFSDIYKQVHLQAHLNNSFSLFISKFLAFQLWGRYNTQQSLYTLSLKFKGLVQKISQDKSSAVKNTKQKQTC